VIWISEVDVRSAEKCLWALQLELPSAVWENVCSRIQPLIDFAEQSLGDGK
jgi:hypothetical protein